MKPIYIDSSIIEKEAKKRFNFPENLMMENAASAMENLILSLNSSHIIGKILIICGSGNNGGDGLALARKLYGAIPLEVLLLSDPKTDEAKLQLLMAKSLNITFTTLSEINWKCFEPTDIIVDCVYGTGFHGNFTCEVSELFKTINAIEAIKIACDIPSGLDKDGKADIDAFNTDFTVTMGALKTSLFSDQAKSICGKILIANLGITEKVFSNCGNPDAYLIQKEDLKLPVRKNKSAHKGTYGHTLIYSGNKSGAAILSANAALRFGSGLTSLLETEKSNLKQFLISPGLMITKSIPQKTSAIVIGNGLGISENTPDENEKLISSFKNWFSSTKNPACVIDADLFSYSKIKELLSFLNEINDARIILTPHPKEFQMLANALNLENRQNYSIEEVLTNRLRLGKLFCQLYPNITLVFKSANTFIFSDKDTFICTEGTQALSKGGSGDILAGMIGALLAQGYDCKSAAITACFAHGQASAIPQSENYSLTPEKLIENLQF